MFQIKKNKIKVQSSSSTKRDFHYTKNNISLNFTLRTDIKQELADFKEMLMVALDDVEAEIQK